MSECIEREAVMKIIDDYGTAHGSVLGSHSGAVDAVGDYIYHLPAADVAPVVHGSWDGTADGYADGELVYDMWSCSVCGFDADGADEKPAWKFCPNCGAKMDG